MKCKYCGYEDHSFARVCPICGEAVEEQTVGVRNTGIKISEAKKADMKTAGTKAAEPPQLSREATEIKESREAKDKEAGEEKPIENISPKDKTPLQEDEKEKTSLASKVLVGIVMALICIGGIWFFAGDLFKSASIAGDWYSIHNDTVYHMKISSSYAVSVYERDDINFETMQGMWNQESNVLDIEGQIYSLSEVNGEKALVNTDWDGSSEYWFNSLETCLKNNGGFESGSYLLTLLNKCEISFFGDNGEGKCDIWHPTLTEDNSKNLIYVANSLVYHDDRTENLSNGDKFTLSVTYNKKLAEMLNVEVEDEPREITVEGLTEYYISASDIPKKLVKKLKKNAIKSINAFNDWNEISSRQLVKMYFYVNPENTKETRVVAIAKISYFDDFFGEARTQYLAFYLENLTSNTEDFTFRSRMFSSGLNSAEEALDAIFYNGEEEYCQEININ